MGMTELPVMLEVLKRCSLLITNDSGPMHLAAALNLPTISFFGPTDPDKTGPYGSNHKIFRTAVPCAPCFERQCPLPKQLCLDDAFNPGIVADYVLSTL
jgi:ADP-heptose:LPS heptosyltransferase